MNVEMNAEKNDPKIKLNLGSGKERIDGYLNIDLDPAMNPDIIWAVEMLGPDSTCIKTLIGPVVEIRAWHILEHLPVDLIGWEAAKKYYVEIIQKWFGILEKGGLLKLAVPDIDEIMSRWGEMLKAGGDPAEEFQLSRSIYGMSFNRFQKHYFGFSERTLKEVLKGIPFSTVTVKKIKESKALIAECIK